MDSPTESTAMDDSHDSHSTDLNQNQKNGNGHSFQQQQKSAPFLRLQSQATGGRKIMGIEFAPLQIPFRRRLETFVLFCLVIEFLLGYFAVLFLSYAFFTSYWYLALAYAAWLYIDRETPKRGGRLIKWTRRLFFWNYFVSYFPLTLHKTADLDPDRNYVFGYHPHGIMASGAFGSFLTEAAGFSSKFPGITTHLITLSVNFWFPIHRDIALGRGLVDSSKESINWILQRKGKGNAVVIVVGGAAESLDAVPNTMRLTLKNRKGFIRMALQNGASVVPVISFGENELFIQSAHSEDSWVRKFQNQMKSLLTFTVPVFHGRGVFQYSMGMIPYRTPIHTIVGSPIIVPEPVPQPSQKQVDELHAKYIQGLTDIFNANKGKYAGNPDIQLELQ